MDCRRHFFHNLPCIRPIFWIFTSMPSYTACLTNEQKYVRTTCLESLRTPPPTASRILDLYLHDAEGWNKLWGRGKCPPPRFRCKGQDYIFALPLFDSFTTYGELKFVGSLLGAPFPALPSSVFP